MFFESSKACRNCTNVNDDGGFAGIVRDSSAVLLANPAIGWLGVP